MPQTLYTKKDKKALNKLKNTFMLFAGFLCFTSITIKKNQEGERITSQQQLEQLVEEEKSKLNCGLEIKSYIINDDIIKTKLHGQCPFACSYEANKDNKKDFQEILINASQVGANAVRHEIYHACAGHNKTRAQINSRFFKNFYYAFRAEPVAQLYTAYGIKL